MFCKAANVTVLIVEGRKEFLVSGQVLFGAPLQWRANKYKASRCPIFSDIPVKAILLLQTDSTGGQLLADGLSGRRCVQMDYL